MSRAGKTLSLLGAGTLVVAVVVGVLLRWGREGSHREESPRPPRGDASLAVELLAVEPGLELPGDVPAASRETSSVDPEAATVAPDRRVRCLRRHDEEPIAGIRIYSKGRGVAGPSGEDGWIDLDGEQAPPLTVWGAGWKPVLVKAYEETPDIVLLEEAGGSLEVRIVDLLPEEGVVRTLLQPRGFLITGTDPWTPSLVETAPDRLSAEGLPIGAYDVYVWVARPPEPPRCLSASGVGVTATEPARLVLTATAAPDQEPDG